MLLSDLKVVEWSTWVAGPGCAAVMADWGAKVIKVEAAAGDATRTFWPDTAESPGNPIFSNENRGKRGVVLDVGKPQGRAALIAILKDADVFVTNVRPGALKRARLDYDSLKAELPRLIYANVTGYGLTGPEADTPAFDLTGFWTRSGVAAATIPPDQEPFTCRPGFGDHVTALATLSGVLAAVHERDRTGVGRQVETSLIRAGCYALGWDYAVHLRYGQAVTAQPRHDRPGALGGFFRTKDERWFCMAPRGPRDFPAVMSAIGRSDYVTDPRCTPPITDLEVVREIRAVLDAAFAGMTLAEAGAMLTGVDVIWAPMATLSDVVADPTAHEAGCFVETPDGWGGSFRAPAAPVRFPATPTGPAGPAPRLGEHTREVLAEAGYDPAAVEALIAGGAAT
ncbi:MAG: CoA transferase [Phenylobacterium sp.]|jgi:crotonobetainyl-CoA:carnitine CoA-transferase CaiB-like acyl-CoA transferase|uniref:CaiB/BaiF CoA transferase family protein n=1 Tax=Phenylobacterium sp. TaxID=1871053 RepID=UPI0026376F7F|nr:CoA transferase [Phenylobacterium sp.]MDB5434420.1 CoA transferase [Phenylobacterium sp.]MDB5496767.1 CoA transferase [Phenylobacterium sp.]